MSDILTLREAAQELRVSREHIRHIRNGRFWDLPPLPFIHMGRRVLIRREALETWLLSLEQRGLESAYATGRFARRIDADPVYERRSAA